MSNDLMLRPPADPLAFVRDIGIAAFGDSWIPRVAHSIHAEECTEASIAERAVVLARHEEWLSRWALQVLDAASARVNNVRCAVAAAMEDRRIERVRAVEPEKPIDLEALRAHVRANEPPMVAAFLEDLLTD